MLSNIYNNCAYASFKKAVKASSWFKLKETQGWYQAEHKCNAWFKSKHTKASIVSDVEPNPVKSAYGRGGGRGAGKGAGRGWRGDRFRIDREQYIYRIKRVYP